mmetsp:Transcript_26323/g.25504  ORF Transcript_26323/g.25504 Transcript_26323/m.25504 type:complete len:113 (+) Transcript_26323:398-736(+)
MGFFVLIFLYLPNYPALNLTFIISHIISFMLGVAGGLGFLRNSPFNNLVLTAYCVMYVWNIAVMNLFFSGDLSFIKTFGEGINLIICLVLASGIWRLGAEEAHDIEEHDKED